MLFGNTRSSEQNVRARKTRVRDSGFSRSSDRQKPRCLYLAPHSSREISSCSLTYLMISFWFFQRASMTDLIEVRPELLVLQHEFCARLVPGVHDCGGISEDPTAQPNRRH